MVTKTFEYSGAKYRLVRDGIDYLVQERKRHIFSKYWETLYIFSSKERAVGCIEELCNQPHNTTEVISYHSPEKQNSLTFLDFLNS
jgi:hypothetical protein